LESNSESYKNYDTYSFEIEPGDVVFIASDGTYHFIELSNVNKIIRDNIDKNFMANSKLIVQEALENKSNDNCSSIVIECVNVNE
jgi:serine/threonine protein phosphatase PrpC